MNAETSPTVTRCPNCGTAFRVTEAQLSIANGAVRCGSCLSVFKAADHPLQDSTSQTQIDQTPNEPATPAADKEEEEENSNEPLFGEGGDDIYDVAPQSRKGATLFERKPQKNQKRTAESADESWAVDLLAEIEDDDIEPLVIKRKPKEESSHAADTEDSNQPLNDPKETLDVEPTIRATDTAQKPHDRPASEELDEISNDLEELLNTLPATEDELSDPTISDDPSDSEYQGFLDNFDDFDSFSADDEPEKKPVKNEDIAEHVPMEAIDRALSYEPAYAEDQDYLKRIDAGPLELWRNGPVKRNWLMLLGSILAALLIAVQVFTFRFESLSKIEPYRQGYEWICSFVGCQLAPLSAIADIRASNLVVRSHPNEPNALLVDTMLLNRASFPQEFPALLLEFTNITGKAVASRKFQPHEYLGGELAGQPLIPSNQPVHISLELVDPGEHAVNYRIQVVPAN